MPKLKGKRLAGEPGTISYGGYKIYNNKGEGGANYLIYTPDGRLEDGANTLGEAKGVVEMYLGADKKKFGGKVTKMRLGGLASADPFGDKRRKESAKTMAKLKKGAKTAKKIRTKPIKISIQSASITTPKGMSIEKNTIMPKMMSKGGVVDMTRSIQINPETGE